MGREEGSACSVCEPNRSGEPIRDDETLVAFDAEKANGTTIESMASALGRMKSACKSMSFCVHSSSHMREEDAECLRVTLRVRKHDFAEAARVARSFGDGSILGTQLSYVADALLGEGPCSPERLRPLPAEF